MKTKWVFLSSSGEVAYIRLDTIIEVGALESQPNACFIVLAPHGRQLLVDGRSPVSMINLLAEIEEDPDTWIIDA